MHALFIFSKEVLPRLKVLIFIKTNINRKIETFDVASCINSNLNDLLHIFALSVLFVYFFSGRLSFLVYIKNP